MYKGRLFLERIKDSKIVKSYYYERLVVDFEEKKKLKTIYLDSGNYRLYCGCNRQKEMKIDKDFKRIYPASNSINHRKGCPRNNDDAYFNKTWLTDKETGKTFATINFSLEPNIQKNNLNHNFNEGLGILSFIKKLNYQTSQKQLSNNQFPSNKFDFWQTVCYKETRLISLNSTALVGPNKTNNLREMLFKPYKDFKMNDDESRFVYMYLSNFEDLNNGNFEITCNYKKSNNEIGNFKFIVKSKKFYESLKKSNIRTESLQKGNFIVGGFVFKNKFKRIEFFELAILRCNDRGYYLNNSYKG